MSKRTSRHHSHSHHLYPGRPLSIAFYFLISLTVTASALSILPFQGRGGSALPRFARTSTIMSEAAKKSRVMVVGSANQDLTSYTPVVPVIGETVMGNTFDTSCGGKGANQAVAAACLDIVPVSMVCRVADDVFGKSLLANFRNFGVEYERASTVLMDTKESSGVAAITVDTACGDNMIIVTPGTNFELTADDIRKELEAKKDEVAVVIVQLEIKPEAALEALRVGKEIGAITILNTAPAPEDFTLDEFYEHIDILIPNETELRKICDRPSNDDCDEEELAKLVLSKGVNTCLVTLGARGSMTVSKKPDGTTETTMVSAPADLPCRDDPVEDTIGAGDAFCGALASYLAAGLELSDAATKASGFASMTVRKRGAQSSYPTSDELPECLKISTATDFASIKKPLLTFATENQNKLNEVKLILGNADLPFEVTSKNVELLELQGSYEDIAKEKCKVAAEVVGGPTVIEDTSLCFEALNGLPGPYIKWFLEQCGCDGLNNMLKGFDDKRAYIQSVTAFTLGPGEEVHVFVGRTDGTIVMPRGDMGFGWDPIFQPTEGDGRTFAQMTKPEKNTISHRGRSMTKLKEFLLTLKEDE